MSSYRERALNKLGNNNTSKNIINDNTTSSYRQRALNRQQPKVEEPKVEIAEVEEQKYNFTPEDAINLKNTLNSRLQRINDKNLSDYAKTLTPEKIEELKSTSGVLHPELLEKKNPDAKYYFGKFYTGTGEAVENIADATIALGSNVGKMQTKTLEKVTSLGGLLPNKISENYRKMGDDLQKLKESAYANDFLPIKDATETLEYEYSPNKVEAVVGDVLSGTGGMLPTIASNLLVPGSGYATLGLQGAGGGTKQAYEKTGNLGAKEEIYGLLSGLSEIAVEKLSGGIGGLGNGAIDDIASKLIKNGFIRNATGEGIEEAVTTFIDPYLQRLTYDKGAEGAKASEVLRSAIVGSLTSMLLQGGSAAINLPQTIQQSKQNRADLQNSLEGIEKMLPTYESQVETAQPEKNVARELPTMASQQAMLPTNRIEGQTVQTGNIEQMAKNIENNNILEYNNDRGVENGEKTNSERYTSEVRDGLHEEGTKENRQYNTTEYERWEQSLKPISRERLTTEEITDIDNTQKEYGKTVNLIDENENSNKYSGGASLIKKGQLNISRQQAEYFGLKNMIEHEVVEDDILHDDVANDILTPAIELIMNDAKFDDQKKAFWEGQTDNIPTDELIAKDILCDRFAEIKNNTKMKYDNILSPEVNKTVDMALQNYYKQVYGKNLNIQADTQSAFSMPKNYISPAQDMQKATEFISKATVEDIDTLNKMVEEAEKYPDRVDLQFFAEKARKQIEYLTKSQRYLAKRVDELSDNLSKKYGIVKEDVKRIIKKYTNLYNQDANSNTLKDNLLKEIKVNNILGDSAFNEISSEIDKLNNELDTVRRYETEKAKNEEIKNQNKQYYRVNKEAISKLYELRKQYQEKSDKAMRDILLTKSDSIQLDRLLKGEITFDELPNNVNSEQIKKAYDVQKPLVDVSQEIRMYNKATKKQRFDTMKELTKNSSQWKDKKVGLAYARETQERNIADIAPEEDANRIKKEIFEPIHHNESEATRYKNELRKKIKALKLDLKPKYEVTYKDSEGTKTEKVSESGLVQLYGEKKISDKTLEGLNADIKKIKTAVETFREIYNDIYSKTNDVLIENGYAPVEFRKDYFPHFEETKPDTIIGKALSKLGFKIDTRELPTDIAGITHTFRPGKKWVSNFLKRTTDVATYDAVKGFDSYIDSVADVIYHTEDIQKLRAYEDALRYQHSDKVIKEQADEIINMDNVASEMKQSMLDQLYANAENSLAHYVTDLRAYTDSLAGKKSLEDRTMEHNLGRGIYNITKNVQNRVSANMVGANISSALTNFIPITQATGVVDTKYLLQGIWDTVKNAIKSDGFTERSDFLVNRRGSDKLYKTKTDKLAGATNLMSLFDNITSEVINRGRYYQNVANGMTETDAMLEAGKMSGNILGDRSKGAMPTVFNQSSPMTKLLTAFQLEVNNQFSYMLKDMPKDLKDEAIGTMIWAFAKVFIGAWLYNEAAEEVIGRRPALDPIDIVAETVGDIKEGKKASEVTLNLGKQIVEEIPFVGGLVGGGRLPISTALPDVGETLKAGISLFEEGDKTKAMQTLASELSKPVFYIVPPFGGGQLKKTIEGIYTYSQGGNYGVNAKGEKQLKYPVEQNVGNAVKSALFGKWATPGAKDYIDRGFKPLSANQTEAYEKAMKAGISSDDFFKAYDATRGIESDKDRSGKTIENSKSKKVKEAIDKSTPKLTTKQRKILYDAFNVSKTVQGGSGLPTQSELRANLPKVQIKIEK